MRAALVALLLVVLGPAAAQEPHGGDEAAIRAVIAQWYAELVKKDEGRIDAITAPGFINATPHYRHVDTGAASLGPRVYVSLAAQALKFDYEIERLRIDPNFAKVGVWERGYSYAWAAQKTTERAADTDFILERGEKDGRWRILAYQTGSYGIPPNKKTDPMPDLREQFYATEGKDRDPQADARNAGKF